MSAPDWEGCLFHYTGCATARQIAVDAEMETSYGPHGTGIYATDLHPDGNSPDDINRNCYGGGWSGPDEVLNGVVVLRMDDPRYEFEERAPFIFLLETERSEIAVRIEDILLAVGCREQDGRWKIERWQP